MLGSREEESAGNEHCRPGFTTGPALFFAREQAAYNRGMGPDDKICYCYDVPCRKLWNFARRESLSRPSQMSECLGAGSGCGWCIPILKRIFESARRDDPEALGIEMTSEEYARQRQGYIREQKPKNTF